MSSPWVDGDWLERGSDEGFTYRHGEDGKVTVEVVAPKGVRLKVKKDQPDGPLHIEITLSEGPVDLDRALRVDIIEEDNT